MNKLLIQGGRIFDPGGKLDRVADLLIEGGKIAAIGEHLAGGDAEVLDAAGLLVTPGLIDMHVHLREPGREDKETIYSGTRAAAAGGFTAVCPMPNTNPCIDSMTGVNYIKSVSARDAVVNVYPIAAVTRERKGEQLVEFGELIHSGVIAFSDDGEPVMNADIMQRSLEYLAMFDVPILQHSEDKTISANGQIHKGRASMLTGLAGIPSCAEAVMVARDVLLAEETGGHVHVCHISAAESVNAVRRGQQRDVRVTAEVTPHHLTLTEDAVLDFDTNAKMHPPLRSAEDRAALIEGLIDGTISVIATDHAPHTRNEKLQVFNEAPNGVIGCETAFAVCYTELVKTGRVPLERVIDALTRAPAKVLRLDRGTLNIGAIADVALFDLEREEEITEGFFHSKSRNSPFLGHRLCGLPVTTIVGGRVVFQRAAAALA